MDEEEDNIRHRDEVLARFRESLARPLSDRYFEEDELIDVFDYAGDVYDDYLRVEALLCAARFHPDSEELKQRKAIFFSQYSDETRNKCVEDNAETPGMVWDIMRARVANPQTDKEKKELLDTILNGYDDFTDEEVIQFMDLVAHFGQTQWLKDNMDKLRGKVEFINTLLYEAGVTADINGDTQLSLTMLEELTEVEPYNPFYWIMLAREYASADSMDKAMNAIDYATAINPDDAQALFVKAKILYARDSADKEAADILMKVVDMTKPQDKAEPLRLLTGILTERGENERAEALLQDFVKSNPKEAVDIIPDLIIYKPENIAELLDQYYRINSENPEILWSSWAEELADNGQLRAAMEVLKAYERNSGKRIYCMFPIEAAFRSKHYLDTITLLSQYIENTHEPESDFPSLVVMHALSLAKLYEFDEARKFCDMLLDKFETMYNDDLAKQITFMGVYAIIRRIRDRLDLTADPADWVDYDPMKTE